MTIPFVDLSAQHEEIRADVEQGWRDVTARAAFVLGPEVAAFEAEFAAFSGVRHCVGVASGTDALELAVRAAGIGPGDEVLVPANTFIATALAVQRAGAMPTLVDCDPATHLIDCSDAARRVTARTRAVIPVHLFGQLAPIDSVQDLCQRHGLVIIEDAAQSHGATQGGWPSGGFGALAATSFYPGKNLGAYGDAGAVLTDDDGLAQRLLALRNYGSERKYDHPEIGFNSRLDTLQAVVLSAKLRRLSDWNQRRRDAATRYTELLCDLDEVGLPTTLAGNTHVWHLFVVNVPERDRVMDELTRAGIGVGVHYPRPIHLQGAFAHLGYREGDFPAAEAAARQILSLPMYPHLTPDDQEQVATALTKALRM